jgi:hypothetical protein
MVLSALALNPFELDNTESVIFVNHKGHRMFFIESP